MERRTGSMKSGNSNCDHSALSYNYRVSQKNCSTFQKNCQAYGCFEETDSVSRRLCFEPLFLDLRNVRKFSE